MKIGVMCYIKMLLSKRITHQAITNGLETIKQSGKNTLLGNGQSVQFPIPKSWLSVYPRAAILSKSQLPMLQGVERISSHRRNSAGQERRLPCHPRWPGQPRASGRRWPLVLSLKKEVLGTLLTSLWMAAVVVQCLEWSAVTERSRVQILQPPFFW